VDTTGTVVCPEVESAVERSFKWVLRDYPQVDPAMIANWAEEVARSMQARVANLVSPQRYAYAALKGKVRDWMKSGQANEQVAGIGRDLESIGGLSGSFQGAIDRKILFEQLKATLNERDRYILVLLLEDTTSPATVAKALGTSYPAAAKAIQRVKERIASTLSGARKLDGRGHGSPQFCETKG
jgi:DNA-directed RNA polymerase specialized sigma24 family protein